MFEALQLDRRVIPRGMVRQKDIGGPNTWFCTPLRLRCTPADRPCGPAPTTATSISPAANAMVSDDLLVSRIFRTRQTPVKSQPPQRTHRPLRRAAVRASVIREERRRTQEGPG